MLKYYIYRIHFSMMDQRDCCVFCSYDDCFV